MMIQKLKLFFWKADGMEFTDAPANNTGVFNLIYQGKTIGVLSYNNSVWTFRYTDDFKTLNIAPIVDFPDISKQYQSAVLWPFFAARIPAVNQPYIQAKITKANVNKHDSVELLKLFGYRTITNPFTLSSVYPV